MDKQRPSSDPEAAAWATCVCELEITMKYVCASHVCVYTPELHTALNCCLCVRRMERGDRVCQVLSTKEVFPNGKTYRQRDWVHERCSPIVLPLRPSIQNTWHKILTNIEKSKWVFLMLLETGLPADVVWPITALACWILVD
jgi:hypothetical protein